MHTTPQKGDAMKFIQLMKVTTTRFDDLEAAHEEWLKATEGQRTVTSEFVCRNRENPDEYWIMVEFPDHEAAMRNNELPATEKIAAKMAALVDRPTEFLNLDLIRAD
jgi:quinol monooxygenase YgiN